MGDELSYDHTEYLWVTFWCSYVHRKTSVCRRGYAAVIIFFLAMMLSCGTYSIMTEPVVTEKIEILNPTLLVILVMSSLIISYNCGNDLGQVLEHFKNVVFDEEYATNSVSIRRLYMSRVRFVCNMNNTAYGITLCMFMMFNPVKGYMKGFGWTVPPIPNFFPFDLGYVPILFLTFLMEFTFFLEIVSVAASFVGVTVQLKAQFRILNTSLAELDRRTLRKMNTFGLKEEAARRMCIVENIKHHQTILRWFKKSEKYLSHLFSVITFLAALVLGSECYILVKSLNQPADCTRHLFTLSVELIFAYLFCLLGELLTQESAQVLDSFYGTPWRTMDPSNKSLIYTSLVMNTGSAVRIKSNINIVASLAVFTSIVSTTYNCVSLLVRIAG